MREVRSFHTHLPCLSALPPATRSFVSHFCTFARGEAAFAPLHGFLTSPCPRAYALHPLSTCQLDNRPASYPSGQLAHWSTGQLVYGGGFAALLSTCQLASLSPRASACPLAPLPTCPLATFGRAQPIFGSAIQGYGLTPCSAKTQWVRAYSQSQRKK